MSERTPIVDSASTLTMGAALDEPVLLLNRLYAAVRIVSARRAFSLLCKQLAEVIAVEEEGMRTYDFADWCDIADVRREIEGDQYRWVKTPRLELPVPPVVRLFSYDKFPKLETKLSRRNIFARDEHRCQYCGQRFRLKDLTIDHVIPRVQGGENTWENLVCACYKCNAKKGGRTPSQANMQLIRKPQRPKVDPNRKLRVGPVQFRSWKAFLNNAYWNVELRES